MTFQNPVYHDYLADPFCFRHGDWYYAVGTGRAECYSPKFTGPVVPMAKSRDLQHWEPVGRVLELPAEPFTCFWAPEIAEHASQFYMYYHPCLPGKGYHIRVAVADQPDGPYRDSGRALTDNAFSIDSHPFRDDDGQWWLFYATDFLDFDDKTFRGTALVVDKLKSMTELAGHPQVVMRAHWPWQRYEAQQKSHGVVADWYTLEGPTVRKRNGRYYCFYSGGNYQNESYGVDWLEADRIGGPWREVGCERGPQLMRSIPGKVIGPGHHSLVTAPDGTDYAVYHAWNEARTDRLMCVDRLDWTDGRPTIARFKPASLHRLTPTPPRGWNSYDSFGCFINERRALENLRVFVQRLKPHGYEYFVLDAGWFRQFELAGCEFPTKDDPYRVLSDELGRPVPAPCFFPNGFAPIADACHAAGVRFGVHMMRGIPRNSPRARDIANLSDTCSWCPDNFGVDMRKPGAQAYYDSIVELLASWGVDFIKYDDIMGKPPEVEAVINAIGGRDIVLSLSPGNGHQPDGWPTYFRANMVRTSGDIWDNREDFRWVFERWQKFMDLPVPRGCWLDMDMIPFGELQVWNPGGDTGHILMNGRGSRRMSGLNSAQKRTFMTMRALAASPLMMGGNLPATDDESFALLTDPEMLACNQNGVMGKLVEYTDWTSTWLTPHATRPGAGWFAIFNRDGVNPREVSFDAAPPGQLFDIWNRREIARPVRATLPPDEVLFVRYGG